MKQKILIFQIEHLRQYFDHVGFSDHTQGIKQPKFYQFISVAIEKHFTINKDLPGRDNKFAILPDEMLFLTTYLEERKLSMIDHGLDYQDIETSSRLFYRGRFDK